MNFVVIFLPHLSCGVPELLLYIFSLRRNKETENQTFAFIADVNLLRNFSRKMDTFILNQKPVFFFYGIEQHFKATVDSLLTVDSEISLSALFSNAPLVKYP